VVGLDVAGDLPSRLVQRPPLRAPGQALGELAEPRPDERLRLRIAVATTAAGDPSGRQVFTDLAGGEPAAVVRAPASAFQEGWRPRTAASAQAIASSPVAVQRKRSAGDLPGGAVDDRLQVEPSRAGAVHGLVTSRCHSSSGRVTRKPGPGLVDRDGCSNRWVRIARCTRLQLTGPAELATSQRRHHAGAVGRTWPWPR
jgi:hypothetical protein